MSVRKLMAVAAVAASTGVMAANAAIDLENFYFRYDFSDGTKTFIGSAAQSVDPCSNCAMSGSGAYGPGGVNTAFCFSGAPYGIDKIGGSRANGKAVLAADWTLAMSVKPGNENKGVFASLGRANAIGCKVIFLASSSTSGKLYVGTARKKKSGTTYSATDRELAKGGVRGSDPIGGVRVVE